MAQALRELQSPLTVPTEHVNQTYINLRLEKNTLPAEWSVQYLYPPLPLQLPKPTVDILTLKVSDEPISPDEREKGRARLETPATPYTTLVGIPGNEIHAPYWVQITSAIHNGDAGIGNPVGLNGEKRAIALGGIRVTEEADAVGEAKGLAMAMTYKWAALAIFLERLRENGQATDAQVAAARMGGMKTTIKPTDIAAFREMTQSEQFTFWTEAVAMHFNRLDGRGTAAPDMGTNSQIMDRIAEGTDWVACTTDKTGNPSPITAAGVWDSTKKMVSAMQKDNNLGRNVSYAIQGMGNVGKGVLNELLKENPDANVYITDIPQNRDSVLTYIDEFPNLIWVEPDTFWFQPAEVFIPAAVAQVLNEEAQSQLEQTGTAKLIVSAANDPYPLDASGKPIQNYIDRLYAMGIVAPAAWAVNLGGIASIASSREESMELMHHLGEWIVGVYDRSKAESIPMENVFINMVEDYHTRLCRDLGILDQPVIQ